MRIFFLKNNIFNRSFTSQVNSYEKINSALCEAKKMRSGKDEPIAYLMLDVLHVM